MKANITIHRKINNEPITVEMTADVMKEYPNGYLCFAQERLIVTDKDFKEITSNDIIDLVECIF